MYSSLHAALVMSEEGQSDPRGEYSVFGPCIVGIITEGPDGDTGIGAASHIGDGILVTARHVVENRKITKLIHYHSATLSLDSVEIIYPENPDIDLALLRTDFSLARYMKTTYVIGDNRFIPELDHISLGGHLDDWLDDGLVLLPVTVYGYPPIPLSREPVLVAARGEINAIVDPYLGSPHPLFVISPIARGGFSGGPVILGGSYLLGIVTDSLTRNDEAVELGFHAALTVEPILVLLREHGIYPSSNAEMVELILLDEDF